MPACSIPDCGKPHVARGWCNAHYLRWKIHGDPLILKMTDRGAPERYFHEVVMAYGGDDCLTWPFGKDDNGRGQIRQDGRTRIVSRLVCERAHGKPPTPKHEAAHSCGNGHEACCTKRHLTWKTHTENQADRLVHGTSNRGERHGLAKLTEAQVCEIRDLRGKMPQREIGALFGIGQPYVGRIQREERWAWLSEREGA